MSRAAIFLLGVLLCVGAVYAWADEKPKPEIKGSSFLVVRAGQTATIQIYGENLAPKEITVNKPVLQVKLLGVKAAEGEGKKIGSQQVSMEVSVPVQCAPDSYELTLVHPDGSKPNVRLVVVKAAGIELEAKKPNDTFAAAMPLSGASVAVNGVLDGVSTALFCFEGKAGETIEATLIAGRAGSPMDAIFRLRDSKHLSLALSAGRAQKDRLIRFPCPADGKYYLEVSDADEKNGPNLAFRLRLLRKRP